MEISVRDNKKISIGKHCCDDMRDHLLEEEIIVNDNANLLAGKVILKHCPRCGKQIVYSVLKPLIEIEL